MSNRTFTHNEMFPNLRFWPSRRWRVEPFRGVHIFAARRSGKELDAVRRGASMLITPAVFADDLDNLDCRECAFQLCGLFAPSLEDDKTYGEIPASN
jgi:hypothetical protein